MPSRSPPAGGCRAVLAGGLALGLAVSAAPATAASIQRGLTLARTHCATCHAIDRVSPSPLTAAPAFRDLHRSYAVENLSEALAEGIMTGHPSMPQFRFDPDQIEDFIAFLKSLERRR
jgi:cytochrome c